jgi:hypothetical protein
MMITIGLGDDPYGYQCGHLPMGVIFGKLEDQGFD